ncbi:MAG: 50S ribosomal protein L11 methyltransferase [Taibaiella sp.]|nr:50S ribosomal protein L11 methyltransferase [Taibaiella sp.]
MVHKEITINGLQAEQREIAMALLNDLGYTGFEEREDALLAYIPEAEFDEGIITSMAEEQGYTYSIADVAEQNWNALWESGFEPVVVGDFCTIRAHFHAPARDTTHEIVITPKMSFGTGHHATTQLMILAMQGIDFAGRRVLDFGTGTGVLAILAEKLGGADILAIDNDEWAVNNSIENTERNATRHVLVQRATLEDTDGGCFEVVLANINRHILLETMSLLYSKTCSSGILVMSGLLEEDEAIVTQAAKDAGFGIKHVNKLNGWISIACSKC